MDTVTKDFSAPYNPRISVRAVAVGACVALGANAIMMELGGAFGLWRVGVFDAQMARSVGIGLMLWTGLSWFVANLFGAFFAARASDAPYAGDGVVHGVATWGVATLLGTFLMGAMFYGALQTGFLTRDAFDAVDSRLMMAVGFLTDAAGLVAGAVGGRLGVRHEVGEPVGRYRPTTPVMP